MATALTIRKRSGADNQKKKSYEDIEEMMQGLVDLFSHHQIYTQDEKDCFDIIT